MVGPFKTAKCSFILWLGVGDILHQSNIGSTFINGITNSKAVVKSPMWKDWYQPNGIKNLKSKVDVLEKGVCGQYTTLST